MTSRRNGREPTSTRTRGALLVLGIMYLMFSSNWLTNFRQCPSSQCVCCKTMDRQQNFLLHIVVHRGSFNDASHERRVGLWFLPCQEGPKYYFQAQGPFRRYRLEVKEDWDPTCTGSVLPLAYTTRTGPVCANTLTRLLRDVPIRNDDNEFNSQQWIWDALESLTRHGYLSKRQRDDGFGRMLDTILHGSSDEVQQSCHRKDE